METVEKQTTFSHRSHSAWKTRQPLASFPQFPQSLLLVQHKSKKPNQLIALTNYSCTSNLNRRMTNNLLATAFCLLARRWYSMPELFHDNRPEDF
jgi:hypothetical protein